MTELKPCPFCGSEAYAFPDVGYKAGERELSGKTLWFAACSECSAICCGKSKEEAVKDWNRRTE